MSIVNFSITEPLEKKIKRVIKEWGFASKAEFFRFIAIDFIDRHERKRITEDQEIAYLSKKMEKILKEKFKGKKLPSLDKQLEDIL